MGAVIFLKHVNTVFKAETEFAIQIKLKFRCPNTKQLQVTKVLYSEHKNKGQQKNKVL